MYYGKVDVVVSPCAKTNSKISKMKTDTGQRSGKTYLLCVIRYGRTKGNDIVLVKRVAWKGRHKIQNKWEPSEHIVVEQPNLKVPVYKVKSLEDNKIRVLHRNMLLPLGIKFLPEDESEQDSEEEPEYNLCHIDRQIPEKFSQHSNTNNMTPLAQDNLEHGQKVKILLLILKNFLKVMIISKGVWHLLQPFHLTN